MRILYYNWVDYLDDENRGGGVSVYQRNLMRAWGRVKGVEVTFLSAGLSYDLLRRRPRWERVRHGPDENRARRFEIVNSGVLAPAHHAFGAPAQTHHAATAAAFEDFLDKTGPYDVVHFNNLEGVPADVLSLKARWPQTRVILSLHNYYPICPQVNLWYQERLACTDFDAGQRCGDCLPHRPDTRLIRLANALAYHLKCAGIRPGTKAFDVLFRQALRVGGRGARAMGWARRRLRGNQHGPRQAAQTAAQFRDRRAQIIAAINAGCDAVLCVSDRVRAIAQGYGVNETLVHTSYIGTAHAALFAKSRPASTLLAQDGTLRVAYLGYMRPDKGFFFLLDALEALPDEDAARLHLVVAAQAGPGPVMTRLRSLGSRLASLTHVDGYTADALDGVLEGVDLGLVPVLWEDNLPQVAIEMHARHIPLLTSDMGGAAELGRHGDLVFRAGNLGDFAARIAHVLAGRVDLAGYWAGAQAPLSMAEHMHDLRRHYEG